MSLHFPYNITVKRTKDWYEIGGQEYIMKSWCYSNIGSNNNWECLSNIFFFKDEQDKLLFKLQWANFCI